MKTLKHVLLLLILIISALTNNHAYAQPPQDSHKVSIRLLAEHGKVKGGDELWIGMEQIIADHWHTYWKNPGDSGTPPAIVWDLPDGFEVSDIVWPTPKKLPYPPLMNYGYAEHILLPQRLTLPEELPKGPIELTADIELLVCKEECIPEYGTYTLLLNGPDAESEDNSAYFENALKNVPADTDWNVEFSENDEDFVLIAELPSNIQQSINTGTIQFFPVDWGMVKNAEASVSALSGNTLTIEQPRGERSLDALEQMSGVIAFETTDGEQRAYNITAQQAAKPVISKIEQAVDSEDVPLGFFGAIIFALIGGLILNLMPCVFPVLSIKALSLVKVAQKHPELARKHGIAYTLGVVLSFVIIAGILIALQTAGAEIGWGFQLQNPWIVGALGYLLFILGLNLMGFFEFSPPFANLGGKLTQKEGPIGTFFAGILATLVATPCTAPFMAGALGYALVQPPIVALIIFVSLGLGLALPYLVLSFVPSLQSCLPKPGAWMEIFKQFLAFPMFVASLWLFWVLSQQTTVENLTAALLGVLLLTFGIWLFRHQPADKFYKRFVDVIGLLCMLLAFGFLPMHATSPKNALMVNMDSQPYNVAAYERALASDNPVFTEMTASWCITCKVNEAVALDVSSTKALFARNGVKYLIGDWTNEDPEITKYLKKYGRNGVPLYVFYGAPDKETGKRPEPVILPQLLTPGIVAQTVEGN